MEKRIFYYDTDSGGIVYYANYLKYMEEARTEFLEKKGLSVAVFQERGLLYAVSRCVVDYRSPACYGETLQCSAELKKASAVKLIFSQSIVEKSTKRLIAEAEVTLVCLNNQFKPTAIPEDLKEKLA